MERRDFFSSRARGACEPRVFPLIVRVAEDSDKFNIPLVARSPDNKRLFKAGRNSLRSRRIAHCPVETMSRLSLLRHFIVVNPLMVAASPRPTGGRAKCFFLHSSHLFPVRLPATILNDRTAGSCEERTKGSPVSRSDTEVLRIERSAVTLKRFVWFICVYLIQYYLWH